MTGRDLSQRERLRVEVAQITAAANSQMNELRMPAEATPAQRREVRAARRAVWAVRQAAIRAVTVAARGPSRAERSAANRAAHARGPVAQQIQQRRVARAARRETQALYRAAEEQQ